ncbi:hypothetical protein BWQ96_07561 [Gracilariopsis chorda]|uniref:Uncharacterized protein n=1 Tax=Gracilariopsis chorda TaxID=448386 RepID=A0A2V3IKZ2_9FLOR|nr:hypothetical protein BWQ96_07561 [Gracilariopsis chorda]|eukprot:PXF42746.1 hypothetical protein BWQ96_07561 [Gracilariopsis chorda]
MAGSEEDPLLVLPSSKGLLRDLSEEDAYDCLNLAMKDAHNAVIRGSAVSGRKNGKKRCNSTSRERLKLQNLLDIPSEVLNLLIANLRESVTTTASARERSEELDSDEFEYQMKKIFRGVMALYRHVGMKFFVDVFGSE